MHPLLTLLQSRCSDNWLIGYDSQQFTDLTWRFYRVFQQYSGTKVLVAHTEPWEFLACVLGAIASNCPVFIASPDWLDKEWEQVYDNLYIKLSWGNSVNTKLLSFQEIKQTEILPQPLYKNSLKQDNINSLPSNSIMIPTGGTSGEIRFTIHNWDTLKASVTGVYNYFGKKPINSCCLLPLYHVSGLMQFLRSFLTNGKIGILPYHQVKQGERGNINPSHFFISLVPTQLQYLLAHSPDWLSQFQTILLGGAPASEKLLNKAREYQLNIAPTYGMTETASQVVTLYPQEFLAGNNSSGKVLPHAEIAIRDEQGNPLSAFQTGIITIQSQSLCLGYYPNLFGTQTYFVTDDLGYLDLHGYLFSVGRNSQKIITGGENVFPIEVESAILATNLVKDVCVIGYPDATWGEIIIAVYVPSLEEVTGEDIKSAMTTKISTYKQPKHWLSVQELPRNAQGKINYKLIRDIVAKSF